MPSCSSRSTAAAVLLCLVFACLPAHADSYSFRYLGSGGDRAETVDGDDFGDYTLRVNDLSLMSCATFTTGCYHTFYADGTSVYTETPLALRSDPGARAGKGCDLFTEPSTARGQYLCNNGHEIFVGSFDDPQGAYLFGIFDGPNGAADRVTGGADAFVILTPNGSVYYDSEGLDFFYEAVNTTYSVTPEPSSMVLVGSGLLGLVQAGRRRRRRAQEV